MPEVFIVTCKPANEIFDTCVLLGLFSKQLTSWASIRKKPGTTQWNKICFVRNFCDMTKQKYLLPLKSKNFPSAAKLVHLLRLPKKIKYPVDSPGNDYSRNLTQKCSKRKVALFAFFQKHHLAWEFHEVAFWSSTCLHRNRSFSISRCCKKLWKLAS